MAPFVKKGGIMDYWIYIAVFAASLAIFSMIDVLMVKLSVNKKMFWFAVVTLIPILGPAAYFIRKRSLTRG